MKHKFCNLLQVVVLVGSGFVANAQPVLTIQSGVELRWPTLTNNTYRPQWSLPPGTGPWTDLAATTPGTGTTNSLFDGVPIGAQHYQVLEIVPAPAPTASLPVNGGFESGNGVVASNWTTAASQPPVRSSANAHSGSFSMRCLITNVTAAPGEGMLEQFVAAQGGSVTGGQTYEFSFWTRQVTSGPSYVQQYQVQWLNGSGGVVGGTGLVNFNGTIGSWTKTSVPGLVAPATAVNARIFFRFVTGAVLGGHGEVFVDDVVLDSGVAPPDVPGSTNILQVATRSVARISWPTSPGVEYRPQSVTNLASGIWTDITPAITGDGEPKSILLPMTALGEFVRVQSPMEIVLPPTNLHTIASGSTNAIGLEWTASATLGVTGYRVLYGIDNGALTNSLDVGNVTTAIISGLTPSQTYYLAVLTLAGVNQSVPSDIISGQTDTEVGMVALFNAGTVLEPPTTVDTPTALITYFADRARDRHAREDMFNAYDHYLSWYWEQRMANIEVVDRVAKGGTNITFNYVTQDRLNPAEFRTFFRGINTVAEYHNNQVAALVSTNASSTPGEIDYHYTATVTANSQFNRPLQLGDRVEIEISQFLNAPRNGRANYYGTTVLYIVGQGIVPWAAGKDVGFDGGIVGNINQSLDSYPLSTNAWLGGQTTLPYQYSNEPEHRFKQTAGNISPTNGQPFMLGRRLHHTDFGNGAHSESGNPIFAEHVGKLGPKFIARSCVECHINNGRALPPAVGAPMFQSVVKVGTNASGSSHPTLGAVLQPQSTSGPVEGSATIASYTTNNFQYGDGTPYSLRKPNYVFTGTIPTFFSVRLAPQLMGLGLLEAVSENTVAASADPDDANADGISGRMQIVIDPETGYLRLGRFTGKGGKARLSHQVAAALNTDMGVPTAIFPKLDGEATNSALELSAADLDKMVRYVALLGVGARRDLTNAQALQGEQLFVTAQCVKCHTPMLTTSAYHPMTELRNQTIRPYTDLLLHDMGTGLADNMGEGNATGSEWRTPPLWNIGLTLGVSGGEAYLHDGRARSLEEAILWHGGEAEASKEAFRTMSAPNRAALIKFLKSL